LLHRKQPEPQDVQEITARTLAYYEDRAEEFRAGTRDNDVSQNITALLRHIQGESPFTMQELLPVLRQLHAALKPAGVPFRSNPHGENEEG
jgi:hypothetical protein